MADANKKNEDGWWPFKQQGYSPSPKQRTSMTFQGYISPKSPVINKTQKDLFEPQDNSNFKPRDSKTQQSEIMFDKPQQPKDRKYILNSPNMQSSVLKAYTDQPVQPIKIYGPPEPGIIEKTQNREQEYYQKVNYRKKENVSNQYKVGEKFIYDE